MTKPNDFHVTPVNDLREHTVTRTCWCQPLLRPCWEGEAIDDVQPVIVVHNSADGRELVEKHGVN